MSSNLLCRIILKFSNACLRVNILFVQKMGKSYLSHLPLFHDEQHYDNNNNHFIEK